MRFDTWSRIPLLSRSSNHVLHNTFMLHPLLLIPCRAIRLLTVIPLFWKKTIVFDCFSLVDATSLKPNIQTEFDMCAFPNFSRLNKWSWWIWTAQPWMPMFYISILSWNSCDRKPISNNKSNYVLKQQVWVLYSNLISRTLSSNLTTNPSSRTCATCWKVSRNTI